MPEKTRRTTSASAFAHGAHSEPVSGVVVVTGRGNLAGAGLNHYAGEFPERQRYGAFINADARENRYT